MVVILNQELILMILDRLSSEGEEQSIKSMSAACKYLHTLESTHRTSAKILRPHLLPTVLRRYPNLTHLDLSLCLNHHTCALPPSLLSLRLTSSTFLTASGVLSKLVELHLTNATDLTDSAAASIPTVAPNLNKLSLLRCKLLSDVGVSHIALGCSYLNSVSLKWCLRVSDFGVSLLALNCIHIRSFDLSFLPITEKCLTPILQLPCLEDLVLIGCLGLDDDGLALLKHGCATLRTLDLSNCQNITHTGLVNLTRGAKCLREITLAYGSPVSATLLLM